MFGKYVDICTVTDGTQIHNRDKWPAKREHWMTVYVKREQNQRHCHMYWVPEDDQSVNETNHIFTGNYIKSDEATWTRENVTGTQCEYTLVEDARCPWSARRQIQVGGEYWVDLRQHQIRGLDDNSLESNSKVIITSSNSERVTH